MSPKKYLHVVLVSHPSEVSKGFWPDTRGHVAIVAGNEEENIFDFLKMAAISTGRRKDFCLFACRQPEHEIFLRVIFSQVLVEEGEIEEVRWTRINISLVKILEELQKHFKIDFKVN